MEDDLIMRWPVLKAQILLNIRSINFRFKFVEIEREFMYVMAKAANLNFGQVQWNK